MDRETLLRLDAVAGKTSAELAAEDPALLATLREASATRLRGELVEHLGGASEELRRLAGEVDVAGAGDPGERLVAGLTERGAPAHVLDEAKRVTARLATPPMLALDRLSGAPLAADPAVHDELVRARLHRLGSIAGVPEDRIERLVAADATVASVDDAALRGLVGSGAMAEAEARDFGLTVSVYRLVDEDLALTERLRGERVPGLPDQPVTSVRDLARLRETDWHRLLDEAGTVPPVGLDRAQYARLLAKRVEVLYPTDALVGRLLPAQPPALEPDLAGVAPLFAQHERLFGNTAGPDPSTLPPDQVRTHYQALRRLTASYPGLGLGEILDDTATPPADRAARVHQRLDALRRFVDDNAEVELLNLDYALDSPDLAQLNVGGLGAEERIRVVATVKAYQRVHALSQDADHAETMLAAGYSSATSIVADGFEAFAAKTALSADTATSYFSEAVKAVGATATATVSILDAIADGFGKTHVSNIGPAIADYFRRVDGFADLFGNQDYCDCAHCSSILGPGAYFVDLMHFVDTKLVDRVFTGARRGHALDLRVRRPDLWRLPVTCENVTTEVPQLVLVNEILENYIARGYGYPGSLDDRAAVRTEVYRNRIAPAVDSFRQPFLLPLERLHTYLRHFDRSRGDIARTLRAGSDVAAAAELGLSRRELELITQANPAVDFLRRVYGVDFQLGGDGVAVAIDAQALLRPVGVDRAELGALVGTDFVAAAGAEPVQIVGDRRGAGSVQNDVEWVRGLRASSLDRMHRFTRLWRCVGWSVEELDLTLSHLAHAGLASGIQLATTRQLVRVRELRERFRLPVEATTVLYDLLPTRPARAGETALFDRAFNLPDFVRIDGSFPKDGVRYVHPSLADDPAAPVPHAHRRLLAGLRVSAVDLAALVTGLAPALGADPAAATEADRGFVLSLANLSLLYRHARLAEWLRLPVSTLLRLVGLSSGVAGAHLGNLDELEAFLRFSDWLRETGRTAAEVAFVTGAPVATPAAFPDPLAIAPRVVLKVADDGILTFGDTLFGYLDEVSEAHSRAMVAANPATIVATGQPGQYRLADDADLTTALRTPATLPATVAALEPAMRQLLAPHHPTGVLASYLAPELRLSAPVCAALLDLAGVDLSDPDLSAALRGEPRRAAALDRAVAAVVRPAVLVKGAELDADAVRFVGADPARFAIADVATLTWPAIARVATYRRFAKGERGADLRTVLAAFDPATGFAAADLTALGKVLGVEPTLAASVRAHVDLPGEALPALAVLAECVDLAARLGVGGEELALVVADSYERLDEAADAVLAAFRAKYPDERVWQEKIDPFEQHLLNRRRDALVEHLVHSADPGFPSREDIYRYFLIDVEVDGCFRTSRIVAAISSLQLYVHRVLMNLEQDKAGAVHVRPDYVPRDEWDWRAHYRVWEANRKVFLWPENYLVPDLRDDKTPLFVELESQLLQKEIDEQGVLDSYGQYLEGFREVAGLKIAGSYHDIDETQQTDVLHLFGVTPGDPPTYYHRTVENAYHGEMLENRGVVWGPWRKMDVKISVRRVAPVVQDGRLHVFWVDITTTPQNQVSDGGSRFVGYSHRLAVKFSTLRLDGRWTAPQDIRLYGTRPFAESDGVLDDPLAEPDEWEDFIESVLSLGGFGLFSNPNVSETMRSLITPRYDTQPHTKARDGYTLRGSEWERVFPEPRWGGVFMAGVSYQMRADVDLFAKVATAATSINLDRVALTFNTSPPSPVLCKKGSVLHYGTPSFAYFDDHAYAALVADRAEVDRVLRDLSESGKKTLALTNLYVGQVANIGSGVLQPVNGSLTDGIIDVDGDLYLLQGSVRAGARWLLRRLGTTLAEQVHRALFADGIDGLLATSTQRDLKEATRRVTPIGSVVDDEVNAGKLDFTGPYGTYYREIFFHIPFLIAHHLNSQGRHEQAQRWYQYVFDPTSAEVIPDNPALLAPVNAARKKDRNWRYLEFRNPDVSTLRGILTDGQAIEAYRRDPFNPHAIARMRLTAYQKTIVMRYIDNLLDWADHLFTQFQMETVNEATILYATAADILGERPARVGDCGERSHVHTYDDLKPLLAKGSEFLVEVEHFTWVKQATRFTGKKKAEYAYAMDGATATSATTRALGLASLREIGVGVNRGPVHLVGREDVRAVGRAQVVEASRATAAPREGAAPGEPAGLVPAPRGSRVTVPTAPVALAPAVRVTSMPVAAALGVAGLGVTGLGVTVPAAVPVGARPTGERPAGEPSVAGDAVAVGRVVNPSWNTAKGDHRGSRLKPELTLGATMYVDSSTVQGHLAWSVVRQLVPAFCVPQNKDLLAYWDRVEDRLAKIRGCMDITGVRRSLSLFAPEIDPMMLVRAKAAGLSVTDVVNAVAGEIPPYRFTYLIEKAKQVTAAVQGFGSSLQAALERKDTEELNQLRNTHQRNLLTLTTKAREWDRDAAAGSLDALLRKKTTVEHRRDYYQGLLGTGLVAEEWAQRVFRHAATGGRAVEATFGFLAGALNLMPDVGSPFAMKYGGTAVGGSAHRFAVGTRALADLSDTLAASAGLEAGFVRRDEGWRQQVAAAEDELRELDLQITVAGLKHDISSQSVLLHETTIQQADEVLAFYQDRFTELGLYTYLSEVLQGVHRDAFNAAHALARMAEQAFRYERDDVESTLLRGGYWDAGRAGLLGGAQLMADLLAIEQQFIATNHRTLEVDQSFSLTQVDPAALVALKETGECTFELPEILFDLVYPGHYGRRVKAVRLTIPCVTGPYANVAATLTLTGSSLRREPGLGSDGLVEVPPSRTVSVATSNAQNDAGVFELSFRDERYMPFEGAGAVSRWHLTMPKSFRQFDYSTINDVILRMSYQARADETFRREVEAVNAEVEGTIAYVLKEHGLARVFSLRHDFSTAFNRLLHSPAGTPVAIDLGPGHVPFFVPQSQPLVVTRALLALRPTAGQTIDGVALTVNTATASGFAAEADLGDLPAVDVTAAFAAGLLGRCELTVTDAGDLAPDAPTADDQSSVDDAKLSDLLLYVTYTAG